MPSGDGEFSRPSYQSVIQQDRRAKGVGLRRTDPSLCDDYVSPPKYKSSLLNRYLNDSLRHVMASDKVMDSRRRNHSGSFSSNEYDDDLLSPSSSEVEANGAYRAGKCLAAHKKPSKESRGSVTWISSYLLSLGQYWWWESGGLGLRPDMCLSECGKLFSRPACRNTC